MLAQRASLCRTHPLHLARMPRKVCDVEADRRFRPETCAPPRCACREWSFRTQHYHQRNMTRMQSGVVPAVKARHRPSPARIHGRQNASGMMSEHHQKPPRSYEPPNTRMSRPQRNGNARRTAPDVALFGSDAPSADDGMAAYSRQASSPGYVNIRADVECQHRRCSQSRPKNGLGQTADEQSIEYVCHIFPSKRPCGTVPGKDWSLPSTDVPRLQSRQHSHAKKHQEQNLPPPGIAHKRHSRIVAYIEHRRPMSVPTTTGGCRRTRRRLKKSARDMRSQRSS